MNDDITTFADGVQDIVLRRPGSDFSVEIPRALLRRFRHQRQFRVETPVVPSQFAHWFIARDLLETEPVAGDEIEDSFGEIWKLLEVHRSELNETGQCVAKAFTVQFKLDEFVDVLKTAYTKSSGGVLQRGFRVSKSGVAAKFSGSVQKSENGFNESLFVLVREEIDAERQDALRAPDGTIYEIVKIKKPLYENDWTEIEVRREA